MPVPMDYGILGKSLMPYRMEERYMVNVLVVEDDVNLNQVVCTFLNDNGFNAKGCLNVDDAYDAMYDTKFDLIISDIMMPGTDGFQFAEEVRAHNKDIPFLFMSARDDLESMQKGYRLGADDYITKPINKEQMLLRIGSLMRRANVAKDKQLVCGNLVLDSEAMTATVAGEEIPVTVREFNILFKLLTNPGQTFSRQKLMDEFWGMESETSLRAVDNYIQKLRDKFSMCDGFKINTVHGLGYKAVLS